jgi:hypothetical protein
MGREAEIIFEILDLEFRLRKMISKREKLLQMGSNDEKLNDKIRLIQHKLRVTK